jgi:drug/metabolite transporter, DME family
MGVASGPVPAARMPVLLVVAAGTLFGTAGTAQALGPAGSTPLGVGVVRIVVGALALLIAMPLLGTSPRRLVPLWRTPAMLVTAGTAGAYQLFFFAGVSRAGVALGTLVAVGSAPLFAGLVGWAVLRHRPTVGWLVATMVCLVGLGLLTAPGLAAGSAAGFLLALGAGLCIAGYNVAARVQLDRGVGALEIPTGSFVLGGALLLPLLATQPLAWIPTPSGAVMALYLGVATMGLANVLLTRGMRTLTPGPATTLMLTDPVVASVLGVIVLGESLVAAEFLGLLVILIGLFLQGALAGRATPTEAEPVPVL